MLRGLPTTTTAEWAQQCDSAIVNTCADILSITFDIPRQRSLMQLPVGFGGMGFLSLSAEGPSLALSQQLHFWSLGTIPDSHKDALSPAHVGALA